MKTRPELPLLIPMIFFFALLPSHALLLAERRPLTVGDLSVQNKLQHQIYYIDAARGDDSQQGLSPEAAWESLEKVNSASLRAGEKVLFRRGQSWRGQLVPRSGDAGGVITYGAFGEGEKPILLGSTARNDISDWGHIGNDIWATVPQGAESGGSGNNPLPLTVDVGNIIFDHGEAVGVKKWKRADLRKNGEFFYDAAKSRVLLFSEGNPAKRFRSIELALKRHIINQTGRKSVTYENLDLRYGAAHGIGGSNTRNITVRNCDLSYIGGGHQGTRADGTPVRYGNGVEFWSNARDCIVENSRLWEIYDAALTNQGSGVNIQQNITYRNNVIWNCEYSFEYWNRGAESRTENILFEHNTCVNAGYGWGHGQRPDKNGRHLMFYDNTAVTSNIVVRYNIFCNATDSCLRLHGRDWSHALKLDYNCWFQNDGKLMLWGREVITAEQLEKVKNVKGICANSIVTYPKFVNPGKRDYRLVPGSPLRKFKIGN